MESEFLRAPSVLNDLQKFSSKESAISSLTTLKEIISSSQDEVEFLYKSDGITIIMSFLHCDSKLSNISLKILAGSSRRHEKVRKKLLEYNILQLLTVKIKSELDFSKSILILYTALIVVLVRDDYEAQNEMRTSECLGSLLYMLSCILDEAEHKPPPCKNTELIIYAIIASYKDPRNTRNQTEAGCIIPKILEYFEKQIDYSDRDQLHLAKSFWFLLRTLFDKNKMNQQIFLQSYGLSILFRSLQEVAEGQPEEGEDLLIKITGVLVKLKSHKGFLSQASNYCPIVILCNLLNTTNDLMIQQIIIFLDSLTRKFPHSSQNMRRPEILKQIHQAEITLLDTAARKLCRDIWNRVAHFNTEENSLSLNRHFGFLNFSDDSLNFCVVHNGGDFPDYSMIKNTRSEISFRKNWIFEKYFRRKQTREKERKLRRVITQSFSGDGKANVLGIAGRKIIQIFKTLLSLFTETRSYYINDRYFY